MKGSEAYSPSRICLASIQDFINTEKCICIYWLLLLFCIKGAESRKAHSTPTHRRNIQPTGIFAALVRSTSFHFYMLAFGAKWKAEITQGDLDAGESAPRTPPSLHPCLDGHAWRSKDGGWAPSKHYNSLQCSDAQIEGSVSPAPTRSCPACFVGSLCWQTATVMSSSSIFLCGLQILEIMWIADTVSFGRTLSGFEISHLPQGSFRGLTSLVTL